MGIIFFFGEVDARVFLIEIKKLSYHCRFLKILRGS